MTQPFYHILDYQDLSPQIEPSVFIGPGVCILGDVRIGTGSSIWCNSVIRGDVNRVIIGEKTNIQDLCAIHVTEKFPATLGDQVTVGHHAMVHGCTVGDRCLIGMGSVILDGAEIGEESVIAAGCVVPEGSKIPPGSMVMGLPGKIKRELTLDERKSLVKGAEHYMTYAENYSKNTPSWPIKPKL